MHVAHRPLAATQFYCLSRATVRRFENEMHAAIAFPRNGSKLHESSQTFNGLPVYSVAHKQQSHLLSPIFARANSFHAVRSKLSSSWLTENVLPLTRDRGKKRMGEKKRRKIGAPAGLPLKAGMMRPEIVAK